MDCDEFIPLTDIDTCMVSSPVGAVIETRWGTCDRSCGLSCKQAITRGAVVDPATGKIKIPLPRALYTCPGIYGFSSAVMLPSCAPQSCPPYLPAVISTGVVMIEPTGFGSFDRNQCCNCYLPTIADVRRKLDDFISKNDLHNAVEYTDYDIVHALIKAVQIWNERKPYLPFAIYDCSNFPAKYYWVTGAAGELLYSSVFHYVRNKLQTVRAGLTTDSKNKDEPYLRLAQTLKDEYLEWVDQTKAFMNLNSMSGGLSSIYSVNTSRIF